MKEYEKEFVKISTVRMLRGGTAIKVEMVISEGKFFAMQNALGNTTLSTELLSMIQKAEVSSELL